MTTGYVALLDVLGFSSLISTRDDGSHLDKYLSSIQEALDDTSLGPTVPYVVFSDSIVLTTNSDSDADLLSMLQRCSRVLGHLLRANIALRGAIAYGSYSRSDLTSGVFVAGRAILDANNFEHAQDWVGIMLAPSTVKRIPDAATRFVLTGNDQSGSPEGQAAIQSRLPWSAFVQPCLQIPFHSKHPFEQNDFSGFAVVPTDGVAQPQPIFESLERSIESLNRLRTWAPTPSAQEKYRKCETWIRPICSTWREVTYWNKRLKEEGRMS